MIVSQYMKNSNRRTLCLLGHTHTLFTGQREKEGEREREKELRVLAYYEEHVLFVSNQIYY
jgi:hypothetical protein